MKSRPAPDLSGVDPDALSPKEAEVFACAAEGLSRAQTAEKLGISEAAVRTYIHRIRTKARNKAKSKTRIPPGLTAKEREAVERRALGLTLREIAEELNISIPAVQKRLKKAEKKGVRPVPCSKSFLTEEELEDLNRRAPKDPRAELPKDGMVYRVMTSDRVKKEYLIPLALTGHGGYRAKRRLFEGRAEVIKLHARASRERRRGSAVLYIEAEDGKIVKDILEAEFRRLGEGAWEAVRAASWSAVRAAYRERLDLLAREGGAGLILRVPEGCTKALAFVVRVVPAGKSGSSGMSVIRAVEGVGASGEVLLEGVRAPRRYSGVLLGGRSGSLLEAGVWVLRRGDLVAEAGSRLKVLNWGGSPRARPWLAFPRAPARAAGKRSERAAERIA